MKAFSSSLEIDKTKNSQSFFGSSPLQPKLTIGQPNDKYEQEADAMAERVMRMPLKNKPNGNTNLQSPQIQTKCAACAQEEKLQTKSLMMKTEGGGGIATQSLASKLNNSKGSGSPMPFDTNSYMSQAFGNDFSHVKIHTDSHAIQMNQGLNARAFTHGSDIYFNKGEYAPNSSAGKKLLAHELTHVVQQSRGVIQRKVIDSNFFVTCRESREGSVEHLRNVESWASDIAIETAKEIEYFMSNYHEIKKTDQSKYLWFRDILQRCFHVDYDNYYIRKVFLPLLSLRYRLVANRIATLNHRYVCGANGVEPQGNCTSQPGVGAAWTAPGFNQTELCDIFWQLRTGTQSLAILHEWFHFLFGMGDCGIQNILSVPCYEKFAAEIIKVVPKSYLATCCEPPSTED